MRLSALPIINYDNINSFSYANQWIIRSGDVNTTLYFQIVDLDRSPQATIGGFNVFTPSNALQTNISGIRYLVGIGTQNQPYSVTVTFPSNAASINTFVAQTQGYIPYGSSANFPNIDPTQIFNVTAVQADPNDSSIWMITLPYTQVPNSGNVFFTVQEGNNVRRFSVLNMLDVEMLNEGSC